MHTNTNTQSQSLFIRTVFLHVAEETLASMLLRWLGCGCCKLFSREFGSAMFGPNILYDGWCFFSHPHLRLP